MVIQSVSGIGSFHFLTASLVGGLICSPFSPR